MLTSRVFAEYARLPIENKGEHYSFHTDHLETLTGRVLDAIVEDRADHRIDEDDARALQEAANDTKNKLSNIRFSLEEIDAFLQEQIKSEKIKLYHQIRLDFKRAIQMASINQAQEGGRPSELIVNRTRKNVRNVLNRNNPFADVSIESQQYLYADENGHYNTLEFATGYSIQEREHGEETALVMQPGFKVRRTNSRLGLSNHGITFDDTISTPTVQDNGDVELLFI